MSKDYKLTITTICAASKQDGTPSKQRKLVAKIIVEEAIGFSESHIVKALCAIEFAANNHSEVPIRVWIEEAS